MRNKQILRIGMTLNVKAGKLQEYAEHHKKVWPEVEKALKESGLTNLSIFQYNQKQLFYYAEFIYENENEDQEIGMKKFQEAMKQYAKKPKVEEWENLMHNYQESLPGSKEGVWWIQCDEIYHLK